MEIVWSPEALMDYESVIDYVIFNWSYSVAEDFVKKVNTKIKLIQLQPELFEKVDHKNARRAVIIPQISLFYRIEPEEIVLLRFSNNSQNPENLKF